MHRVYLYRSPYFLVHFIPTGTLLGQSLVWACFTITVSLSMRAAGMSIYRIVSWAMLPAVIFCCHIAASINLSCLPPSAMPPPSEQILFMISLSRLMAIGQSIRDGDSQDVVYISYADNEGGLGEVKRYQLKDGQPIAAPKAKSGVYLPQSDDVMNAQKSPLYWQLSGIDEIGTGITSNKHTAKAKYFTDRN